MGIFTINTMTEQKFTELSNQQKILSTELNIVDDDNIDRTTIVSYNLLKSYVYQLSTALKDINIKNINQTTVGDLYMNIAKIKQIFGTDY